LDIITLTNANYWRKVRPIIGYAPIVDEWLDRNGGHWHVCGKGEHADRISYALEDLQHVTYEGHVDAKEWIADMDIMFHPSNLDGQPNSILEGMASRLPVITNDFEEFTRFNGPLYVVDGAIELKEALEKFKRFEARENWGQKGIDYVREYHSPEAIGEQYVNYFRRLLNANA
jgi:glycosyltransferase involved in cell wall biosynthesis